MITFKFTFVKSSSHRKLQYVYIQSENKAQAIKDFNKLYRIGRIMSITEVKRHE